MPPEDNENEDTGVTDSAAGDQTNQETATEEKSVPYERFTEVNEKLKAAQEQMEGLQDQLTLYKATLSKPEQAPPAKAPPQDDDFAGIDDEEVLTGAELKRVVKAVRSQTTAALSELQFFVQHPDYKDVVGTPDRLAPPIRELLKDHPEIMSEIRKSPNMAQSAYVYTKLYMDRKAKKEASVSDNKTSADIEQDVKAALKAASTPNSLSAAGSQASVNSDNRFQTMSDDEFEAQVEKIKNQG